MKPLDQVRSTGAYAPDHTAKVHNKFDTRRSILEELRAFASSVPDFRRLDKGNIAIGSHIIMADDTRTHGRMFGRPRILEFGRYNSTNYTKWAC
ncbi:hypothetical protein [Duncaniella dubosii]|uniref:hypothetical protein n=1 Tax=Duncaniella dubosii TaxID=2518971 RepID=UPI003F6791B7